MTKIRVAHGECEQAVKAPNDINGCNQPRTLLFLNPISYGCFKYIHVYVLQSFELDAISADARLAEFPAICLGEIFLVLDTEDIDRNSGRVGADPNFIKVPGFSVGIFYGL